MNILILAIVLITVALVGYGWGILDMNHVQTLSEKNIIPLIIAWLCDFTGTMLLVYMSRIIKVKNASFIFVFHTWLGYLVLILMLIMVLWAAHVWYHKQKVSLFLKRYAIIAFILWLIDYITGMFVH